MLRTLADKMSAIHNQNRFAEHAGKTLVTWRMLVATVAECEKAPGRSKRIGKTSIAFKRAWLKMRTALTSPSKKTKESNPYD